MDERQILKRRIELKAQAIKLIQAERAELRERLSLLIMKERLERQIKDEFDPVLSSKLDCVNNLLETR